jgi:hypothetical protein
MARIRTESLQPGLTVAGDVKNVDGMLLIPSGCVLTERHLNVLSAWGVTDIEVASAEGVTEETDPLAHLDPETVKQLTAELKALFWQLDETNGPAMAVFHAALRRLAARRSPGKS